MLKKKIKKKRKRKEKRMANTVTFNLEILKYISFRFPAKIDPNTQKTKHICRMCGCWTCPGSRGSDEAYELLGTWVGRYPPGDIELAKYSHDQEDELSSRVPVCKRCAETLKDNVGDILILGYNFKLGAVQVS